MKKAKIPTQYKDLEKGHVIHLSDDKLEEISEIRAEIDGIHRSIKNLAKEAGRLTDLMWETVEEERPETRLYVCYLEATLDRGKPEVKVKRKRTDYRKLLKEFEKRHSKQVED